MRTPLLALAAALAVAPGAWAGDSPRPAYHFTPPKNFINDPNGLLFVDGEYHLFYQHNPEGDRWGHMSWGHAVSRDLCRWEHLPIALREADGVMIFSGSAVLDRGNSSGLGRADAPPMVAVYTGDGRGRQTQNIASSVDRGRTWSKFAGNPVVDIGSNSFRDPKAFFHAPTNRWVMITVLADDGKARFWGSTDLKSWTPLGDFGPFGPLRRVWECPEMFEAPIEGEPGRARWVFKVDDNLGTPAGGPAGRYFIGSFDGATFTPETTTEAPLWVESGKDFYAAQAWTDAPADAAGRPAWLAWMNNWQYANDIPTSPWRGSMTAPRRVSIRRTPAGLRLAQRPAEAIEAIRRDPRHLDARAVAVGSTPLGADGIGGRALDLVAEFDPPTSGEVGLKVRVGDGEETIVGLAPGSVFVDRARSGIVSFNPEFAARRQSAPTSPGGGPIRLRILVDATSVEVFADDGLAVITDQVFPRSSSVGVSLFATGAPGRLRSLDAWTLAP